MSRRQLGAVLQACLTEPGQPLEPGLARALRAPGAPGALGAASEYHRVSGFVRRAVAATPGIDPLIGERLERAHAATLARHLGVLADLPLVHQVLEDAGIPWLVLKGPVLAETVYPAVDLRPYRDLDVLVPGSRLGQAIDALVAAGAHLLDRNWSLFLARQTGEVHLVLPHGVLCDLHWHVLHDRDQRAAFHLPTSDLLDRARPVAVGSMELPTLEPVDTLHHLLVHACLSGAERLLWLKDVDLVVRALRPDWDRLVSRCRAAGTGLLAAVVLARTRRVVGTPVPPAVLRALDPARAWTGLVTLADRAVPPQWVAAEGSLPRLVARATQRGLWSSLGRLVLRAGSWAVTACHPNRGRWQGAMTVTDPGSARYPAGGEAAYRAFLEIARSHGAEHAAGSDPAFAAARFGASRRTSDTA